MLLSPSILLVLASPAALKTPGSFLWLGEAGSYRQPGLLQITADRGEGRRGGGARVCVCGGGVPLTVRPSCYFTPPPPHGTQPKVCTAAAAAVCGPQCWQEWRSRQREEPRV